MFPLASVVVARREDEPGPFAAATALAVAVFVAALVGAAAAGAGVLSWGVAGAAAGLTARLVVTSAPRRYRVRVFTAAGGFDVVSTADGAHAEAVVAAIGRAASARG